MDGFDLADFGQPERLGRDLQELCGLAKVEPWLDPVLRGLEHRDVVVRTAWMMSAEVLLRCPRRRFGKRNSLWTPPTQ
ncbi:hypothetical protein ABIF97_004237 [Bradyrhizobium japonicum]